jgi:hypothetical protein
MALMLSLLLLFVGLLAAQDQRNVTEPHLPSKYCATLEARFSSEQDAGVDTTRVQNAIDHCASGQAVRFSPHAGNGIFTIAPIHLKAGVTLVVDAGAAVLHRAIRATTTSTWEAALWSTKRATAARFNDVRMRANKQTQFF